VGRLQVADERPGAVPEAAQEALLVEVLVLWLTWANDTLLRIASTESWSFLTSAISASVSSSCDASASTIAGSRAPIAVNAAFSSSSSALPQRWVRYTCAPCRANSSPHARPIPSVPPVMMTA
jgi:hypothetical protein